jgi:hypothetical protein
MQRVVATQVLGGGPENPAADVASVVAFGMTLAELAALAATVEFVDVPKDQCPDDKRRRRKKCKNKVYRGLHERDLVTMQNPFGGIFATSLEVDLDPYLHASGVKPSNWVSVCKHFSQANKRYNLKRLGVAIVCLDDLIGLTRIEDLSDGIDGHRGSPTSEKSKRDGEMLIEYMIPNSAILEIVEVGK